MRGGLRLQINKTKYVCMLDDTDFIPYTTLNKAKIFGKIKVIKHRGD